MFPIASMYGIFTFICLIFMVNVGKYTIHGCYGFGGITSIEFVAISPIKFEIEHNMFDSGHVVTFEVHFPYYL